jgi:hypothetical protein
MAHYADHQPEQSSPPAGVTTNHSTGDAEPGELGAWSLEEIKTALHDVRVAQNQLSASLESLLQAVDVFDLVARASVMYLVLDPNKFVEVESDRSMAHVEYLALRAAGTERSDVSSDSSAMDRYRQTTQALGLTRELFSTVMTGLLYEGFKSRAEGLTDSHESHAFRSRADSLTVRMPAYREHAERVIRGCFSSIEADCIDQLGFSAGHALQISAGIVRLQNRRLKPVFAAMDRWLDDSFAALRRERRRPGRADRRIPDDLLQLAPNEAKAALRRMATADALEDSASIMSVTATDVAAECGLSETVALACLSAFVCHSADYQAEHHALPSGAHPFTRQPILEAGGRFLLPCPSSMLSAIRPRVEDLLSATGLWNRYERARARYVEQEAVALLGDALPGSSIWTNCAWTASTGSSELDGLVQVDNVVFRVQCKGGRISEQARRGAPGRLRRDIGRVISDAAEQHTALDEAIHTDGLDSIGLAEDVVTALGQPIAVEVIVTLDDVTPWATETHELQESGSIAADRAVPWVLSLTDLMAVTDLLDGAQLIHYVLRRLRLERDGRIAAHDELDWVGFYIHDGLYFDGYFQGNDPPSRFQLAPYTTDIDAWYFSRAGSLPVPAAKPEQQIPQQLARLLTRLERERPNGWIVASLALLDGDHSSRQSWDAFLVQLPRSVGAKGWSNATQAFPNGLTQTIYVDHRVEGLELSGSVYRYLATQPPDRQGHRIVIAEGGDRRLRVLLSKRLGAPELRALFLDH